MQILFLRHGQTIVNVQSKVHRRDDDTGLDGVGVEQVHKLAIACRQYGVQELFCSPEKRARQTAEIIEDELGLKPQVLEQLAERDWGDWAGMPWAEIKARLDNMDLGQRYEFAPPNGESWRAMDERLENALGIITSRDKNVVGVVTHGGALRALMPILKNAPKHTSFQYDFLNASITAFDFTNGAWKLIRENDVAHLRQER